MSWSAQHDHDRERQLDHKIEPPEPLPKEERGAPLHQLASDVGNQAFRNALARDGAGIMESGEVHPQVQSTIDSTRGSGASLGKDVRKAIAAAWTKPGGVASLTVPTDCQWGDAGTPRFGKLRVRYGKPIDVTGLDPRDATDQLMAEIERLGEGL